MTSRTRTTVSQLREVYEEVWGRPIDPRNFHRKATPADHPRR